VQRSALDVSHIAERLGWRAQVALAEGLQRTLDAAREELGSAS
jgi:nucleoside-diphosphate-sugar epimerase